MRPAYGMSLTASLLVLPQAYAVALLLGSLVEGGGTLRLVLTCAAIFLLLGIARQAAEQMSGRLAFRAGQAVIHDLRTGLIDRQIRQNPLDRNRSASAQLATLAGPGLDQLLAWFFRYRLAALRVSVIPLIILVVLLPISWTTTIILLVSGPLIPLFMALIGFAARDASEKQLAETLSLNSEVLEWLNTAPDLRLLTATDRVAATFAGTATRLRAKTFSVLKIAFLSSSVLELFAAIGVAMVAVYVGFSLLGTFHIGAWGKVLSVTEGVFILLMAPEFFQPLRDLAGAWHDKANAATIADTLDRMEWASASAILGDGRKCAAMPGPVTIAATDLVLARAGQQRLNFPDFFITAGERIALVGPSGSGKTTLLSLIAGLQVPSSGCITVCGHDLSDETADAWRRRLAYVGQTPHLFQASLRANIGLADPVPDATRVAQAIIDARTSEVLAALPRADQTRLGERGAGVSGGEARRLTLARAFYARADILLADEPTANLDDATAIAIIDTLNELSRRGTTMIIATHDPRLIAHMHRSIMLGSAP